MSFSRVSSIHVALILCGAINLFSQSKSAIQFWDTTGQTKTGRLGWTGNSTTGYLFMQTPTDGEILKIKPGNVEITGNVSATKFTGNGSGLTNVTTGPHSHAIGELTGIKDSLAAKANVNHTHASQGVAQHTHGAAEITSGVLDTSRIKYSEFMIDGAGANGQVWKSDGQGRGFWGTDNGGTGSGTVSTAWNEITGKPTSFPPSVHSHTTTEITDLQTALNNKANISSTYTRDSINSKISSAVDAVKFDGFFQGYASVNYANTVVITMQIDCPANGYIIANASALITDTSSIQNGTAIGLYGDITLDKSTIDGSAYDIVGRNDTWIPFSQTKGFQVTKGTHTLRLIFTPIILKSYKVWKYSMTCMFSQKSL